MQDELDFLSPAAVSRSLTITGRGSTALWDSLRRVYTDLGFEVLADDVFAQLVLARVIKPTSKAGSIRELDSLGIPHAGLRSVFRCLARVQAEDYRSKISRLCFENARVDGNLTLVLYDVTTLYFEAEREDELRKVGFSKERRVDPQIVVGLLTDRTGFPLELTCWEGGKAETLTMLPTVMGFLTRHGLGDLVVVADAGMLSAANLAALDEAGLKFIVGSRQVKAPIDLESHFHWHGDSFEDGQVIDTITVRHGNCREAVSDSRFRDEPVWDPEVHSGSWRAVWAYSRKRAVKDTRNLKKMTDRAIAVINGTKTVKSPRFVKTLQGKKILDEKALDRAHRLVGLKGYVTNMPATRISAAELIADYHELWLIEKSFRMSKSDLKARPVFHHTREAIEAHLTIVMAALAVSHRLQTITGKSVAKIIETLEPIHEMNVNIAGQTLPAHDQITPAAQTILDTLGLTWPPH
ncbi:Transposase [Propionibacterium australiense]|nr:IS1634 family transposase [Propionibacterium australiense]VEH88998.1 Transposase [Propionibacterium australiense]VEH93003.1 Transposase [Propionibacterium australiense]